MLAISRGVVDKDDPRLELPEAQNPVYAWACDEFGEIWVYGFVNGLDAQKQTNDDPEYLAAYELGKQVQQQIFPL